MAPGVQDLRLGLERHTFWAGETVQGTVTFITKGEVECRGVRCKLKGSSFCRFKRGDDTEFGRKNYAEEKVTLWGKWYRTSLLDGCGANADFTVYPGAGSVYIPMSSGQGKRIIVRAMDFDWGKKDDLLAEVELDVDSLVSNNWQPIELSMSYKGKSTDSKVLLRGGIIARPASWGPQYTVAQTFNVLQVDILQCTDLRSGDWMSKNDVYIQVYTKEDAAPPSGSGLPPPQTRAVIPAGFEVTLPVQFTIPPHCPSSIEQRTYSHNGRYYLRYSVYAYVDIAWKSDPSTRCGITVVSPTPMWPAAFMPQTRTESKTVGFACCGGGGEATIEATIDRLAYAPGDALFARIRGSNGSNKDCKLEVRLKRVVLLRSGLGGGPAWHTSEDFLLSSEPVSAGGQFSWEPWRRLDIPLVEPTFSGDMSPTGQWRRDPVVWAYFLEVILDIPMAIDLNVRFPITVVGLPSGVMQTLAGEGHADFSVPTAPLAAPPGMDMAGGGGDSELAECGPMPPASYPPPATEHVAAAYPATGFQPWGAGAVNIKDEDESHEDHATLHPESLQFTPSLPPPQRPMDQPPPTWPKI